MLLIDTMGFLFVFMAAPVAHGSFQARRGIKCELQLRTLLQQGILLTHCAGSGLNCTSKAIQAAAAGFLTHRAIGRTPILCVFKNHSSICMNFQNCSIYAVDESPSEYNSWSAY